MSKADAYTCQQQLKQWLLQQAYPLWSSEGVDPLNGGFQERLDRTGKALREPRRSRVQPRQIYCFARAAALGWGGDAHGIVRRGLHFFRHHYRRADGLYRTLVAPDGSVLDDSVVLYDQAFALLGLAAARGLGSGSAEEDTALEAEAQRLLAALNGQLKRVGAGFYSGLPARLPLLSNPHMHLFEAALAWCEISADSAWRTLADELGSLALESFIDPVNGALRETFDADWLPVSGLEGQRVEPGHQFEWAWLLMRWGERDQATWRAALRLIEIGEHSGVRNGVAVDALLADLSLHDPAARLWPQTERLKAAALAASCTGETRYWGRAVAAASALLRYLETPKAGLWYDRLNAEGAFHDGPAPASSFYHIVAAIEALELALRA